MTVRLQLGDLCWAASDMVGWQRDLSVEPRITRDGARLFLYRRT